MIGPPFPALNVILDDDVARAAGLTVPTLARACLAGGARFLQVRAKTLPSGPFLAMCDEVVALARPAGALVIVNDRADLARLSGADGVHVGQEDLSPADARAVVGADAIVGVSTHTAEQARRALDGPADYVAVGPVFGTRTKEIGYAAVGLDLLRRVTAIARDAARPGRAPTPIVAIGGVTIDRARAAVAAGASAVAVISDLLATRDPEARVREYVAALAAPRGVTDRPSGGRDRPGGEP